MKPGDLTHWRARVRIRVVFRHPAADERRKNAALPQDRLIWPPTSEERRGGLQVQRARAITGNQYDNRKRSVTKHGGNYRVRGGVDVRGRGRGRRGGVFPETTLKALPRLSESVSATIGVLIGPVPNSRGPIATVPVSTHASSPKARLPSPLCSIYEKGQVSK